MRFIGPRPEIPEYVDNELFVFLEKIKPTAILTNLSFGAQTSNPILPTIQIGLFWRLTITFITIIFLRWVSNTNRGRKFLHQFFSMTFSHI